MDQKEFTDYIVPKIIDRFSQLKDLCTIKPNDIVDIDIKSNKDKLLFWLTTQGKEITLGFTGDTKCDWHMHISLFEDNTVDEVLKVAGDFIDEIINDKKAIIHSSVLGYYPLDNLADIDEDLQQDETRKIFYWTDL